MPTVVGTASLVGVLTDVGCPVGSGVLVTPGVSVGVDVVFGNSVGVGVENSTDKVDCVKFAECVDRFEPFGSAEAIRRSPARQKTERRITIPSAVLIRVQKSLMSFSFKSAQTTIR